MTSTCPKINEQVTEPEEEWTTVRRKGRRHPNVTQHTTPYHNGVAPGSRLRSSFLSVSDIEKEHQRIMNQWETSTCRRQLQGIIASRAYIPSISHAICFGLGSFDPEDGSWEGRRRAHIQLAAFLYMVKQLQHKNPQAIRCSFQEPIFNSSDKAFIHSLGHDVIDSPKGFERVDRSTLVFGIHLYRDIYMQAITKYFPAVFVGTPQEVWEECYDYNHLDWVKLKELGARCDKIGFPQDHGYTTFSNTVIHWRRQDEM